MTNLDVILDTASVMLDYKSLLDKRLFVILVSRVVLVELVQQGRLRSTWKTV